jgi:saccharopine dehydrogenase-like NADP-dependent oxidoreductase
MQTILILGAGKSSTYLIDYLLDSAASKNRKLIVADISENIAAQKIKSNPFATSVAFDIDNITERTSLIQKSDLVVSMLPAFLHPIIAKDCLAFGKHFFTASYESDELRSLASEIKAKNLLFLNECGLDPGLDHMSAIKIIEQEKAKGHEIISFKSYCGGVLAPESEDNPWKYKFTWNPRNVIIAGQGVSRYIQNGHIKYIPYHKLFERTEKIIFKEAGEFDGYANRDSLRYRSIYGLETIPTLLRGTLRRSGFCQAWNVFVQLGMTDDSFQMDFPEGMTNREFLSSFLPFHPSKGVEEKLKEYLPMVDIEIMSKIEWMGLFSEKQIPLTKGSPAAVLQKILEVKWHLNPEDKDMVVLQHQFEVKGNFGTKEIISSLVCKGENQEYTAMAKTVGLPLAIAVDLFLEGKIQSRGLQIPVDKELYEPILNILQKEGLIFDEIERVKTQ